MKQGLFYCYFSSIISMSLTKDFSEHVSKRIFLAESLYSSKPVVISSKVTPKLKTSSLKGSVSTLQSGYKRLFFWRGDAYFVEPTNVLTSFALLRSTARSKSINFH